MVLSLEEGGHRDTPPARVSCPRHRAEDTISQATPIVLPTSRRMRRKKPLFLSHYSFTFVTLFRMTLIITTMLTGVTAIENRRSSIISGITKEDDDHIVDRNHIYESVLAPDFQQHSWNIRGSSSKKIAKRDQEEEEEDLGGGKTTQRSSTSNTLPHNIKQGVGRTRSADHEEDKFISSSMHHIANTQHTAAQETSSSLANHADDLQETTTSNDEVLRKDQQSMLLRKQMACPNAQFVVNSIQKNLTLLTT